MRINNAFAVKSAFAKDNLRGKVDHGIIRGEMADSSQLQLNYYNAISNYNRAFISFGKKVIPEVNDKYIESVTKDPRKLNSNLVKTQKELGSKFNSWHKNYVKAYTDYTKRLYNNSNNTVEDLIKFRPDWLPELLIRKYKAINGNDKELILGKAPDSFINNETFSKLSARINDIIVSQIADELKNIDKDNIQAHKKELKIGSINIEGKIFEVKHLLAGRLPKCTFIISNEEGKKYILKTAPESSIDKFNDFDGLGLQAIIDYYLTANDCNNSAKLYIYDSKTNSAIYEYVECDKNYKDVTKKVRRMNEQGIRADFREYIPDVYNLSIKYNDLGGSDNLLKSNNKYILIDSGESTYDNLLMPEIDGYHREIKTRFDNNFRSQIFSPMICM